MPNLGRYLESDGITTMAVLLDLGWLRDAADNLTRGLRLALAMSSSLCEVDIE
jgi:hypothetical protein